LKEIFEDHIDLQWKLNKFLPIECEIKLPLDGEQSSPKKHAKKEDAINFLKKIKVFSARLMDSHDDFSVLIYFQLKESIYFLV
jgi:hypothetical protein